MKAQMIWLSGRELRRDHDVLRQLLARFESSSSLERNALMSLAMDLFEVHSAIEDQSVMPRLSAGGYAAIAGLMELVCDTDPSSRLFQARGLELKRYLEAYLASEDKTAYARDFDVGVQPQNFHLVGKRQRLLEDAAEFLAEPADEPMAWMPLAFQGAASTPALSVAH